MWSASAKRATIQLEVHGSRPGNYPGRLAAALETEMSEPTLWDLLLGALGFGPDTGDSPEDEAGGTWLPSG